MKKLSRLLALLLTLCLMAGVIAIFVSAANEPEYQTTSLGFSYDFQDSAVGATSTVFPSGTGSADNYSTRVVVQGAGENKYYRFASVNTKDAPATYRRDLMYGVYDASKGTRLNDYSYFTLDMDITADGYAIPIGYEITSATSTPTKPTTTTDKETGHVTDTTTTTTTYTVRVEYMIFYPGAEPTEAEVNAAIAAQSTKFKSQLDAAIANMAENHGKVTSSTTSEDGKKTTITDTKVVANAFSGQTITSSTVADDFIAALTAYDYAGAMAEKRLSYSDGLDFNLDNCPLKDNGAFNRSGYNNIYVSFKYEDGEWCVYADGGTSPKKTEYTLSDKVGEWNHFTFAIKTICETTTDKASATGYTYGNSDVKLFFNGNQIASSSTIISNAARTSAAYINPRAINMQPNHYSDEYSMGIDNFVATYYPVIEKAYELDENGAPTTTRAPLNDVHYTSGDNVVGIDDLFAGDVTSIAECEDVLYSRAYVSPAPNGYVKYNGSEEEIYVPSIISDIIENQIWDGQYIETTAHLKNITPRDGASIDIIAADGIEVTLSEEGAKTHTLTKTENGYRVECINQLKTPTVGSAQNLVYGSYAYNDFDGSSLASTFVAGQGMSSHGSFVTRTDGSGNSYWSISKKLTNATANNGVNGYYQWKLSSWENNATKYKYNDLIANYGYAVVDFEFGADRYSAQVGYRFATTTKDSVTTYTIEKAYKTFTSYPTEADINAAIDAQYDKLLVDIEANSEKLKAASIDASPYLEKLTYADVKSSITLSYLPNGTVYLGLRGSKSATENSTANTQVWLYTVKHGEDWYLSSNSTYSENDYKLPSDIGQLTHITFVVSVDAASTTATVTGYVDGVEITTKNWTQPIINLDDIRFQFDKDYKDEDIYSLMLDNLVCNYYEKGYTSGAAMGIDDFVAGDCELWECVDTVWNGSYTSPAGSVKVGGGEASYLKPIFGEALKNIADGTNIVTERGLYDISLGESVQSINVTAKNGANIYLDEESALHFIVEAVSSEGDTVVYLIRRAGPEDAVEIIVHDVLGNEIGTLELLPNAVIDLSEFKGGAYNVENNIYTRVLAWYWDLDGEGTAYSKEFAESFSISDLPYIPEKSIDVYPDTEDIDFSAGYAYVAYYNDNGVTRIVNDNAMDFIDIKNIPETIKASPDGTTIKLVFEGDSIVLAKNAYYEYKGKAITFDLNGKTITRYNGEAYGKALIRIGEGATAIVTSSKPGARVFLLSNRGSTEEGNGNNRIFGADGIAQTDAGVDSAHIEISNLEFNGGTMVKFDGLLSEDVAPSWENDVPITCKIDNVIGYAPNRSSYAIISTLCPDVVVEVTNSKFYVPDGTYAFIHDYAKDGTKIYRSETDLTIKNSEILCYTESATPTLGKLWYTMGVESSLYVENSKIIAKLNGVRAAQASWGAGVEIATDITSYFRSENVAEGVHYLLNNGITDSEISLSFKRADFTTNWSYADSTNGKYIDTAYTNTVDITRSAPITFVTFAEGEAPDYVAKVNWQDQNGADISSSYLFAGLEPTAPKTTAELGLTDVVNAWYSATYVWANAEDDGKIAHSGVNVFKPMLIEATHINGKKANMSLSTGMIFNLYIPLPDESVKEGSIYSPDAITAIEKAMVDGTEMLKISFASELDDFAPTTASICFVGADGKDYTYEVKIDSLQYVTLLANTYTCGTEEAQLAYEIVSYKKAVAEYIASVESKTLDEYLTEAELSAITSFEAAFSDHADGCTCTAGLYSDEEIGSEEMPTAAYTAVGINGFAYLLNSDTNGLRINVGEGTTVKYASYKDLLGTEIIHDEALGNMKLIETETERYFVISGISASDVRGEVTITVEYNGATSTVTYSLAQYINSTDASVAKALYSYSKAAAAYKGVSKSEQK